MHLLDRNTKVKMETSALIALLAPHPAKVHTACKGRGDFVCIGILSSHERDNFCREYLTPLTLITLPYRTLTFPNLQKPPDLDPIHTPSVHYAHEYSPFHHPFLSPFPNPTQPAYLEIHLHLTNQLIYQLFNKHTYTSSPHSPLHQNK